MFVALTLRNSTTFLDSLIAAEKSLWSLTKIAYFSCKIVFTHSFCYFFCSFSDFSRCFRGFPRTFNQLHCSEIVPGKYWSRQSKKRIHSPSHNAVFGRTFFVNEELFVVRAHTFPSETCRETVARIKIFRGAVYNVAKIIVRHRVFHHVLKMKASGRVPGRKEVYML